MRILIFNWKDLAHPSAGGAEVYTQRVAEEWVRVGHEITLFCAGVRGRPGEEVVNGVRIIRRGSRLGVYREARRFWDSEGSRVDLVIDEVNTRPFLTPQFVTGTPVVALIHQVCREIWWYEMPLPVALLGRFWFEPRWLRAYQDIPVLTVSESSRLSLKEYGLRDIRVVPEGIDHHPRPDVDKSSVPTVLFVGRLSRNKRPHHALAAFSVLRKHLPKAQMWIVGEGPMRQRLERSAPSGVKFFGRVDDLKKRELMARAHVLVITSVREGWGLVVDEAAAMKTLSVGYDVSGLRDSLDASGGLAVPPRPAALGETLIRLFRQHDWEVSPSNRGAKCWREAAEVAFRMALGEHSGSTSTMTTDGTL